MGGVMGCVGRVVGEGLWGNEVLGYVDVGVKEI